VERVGCAEVHMELAKDSLRTAASSNTNKESAYETPAFGVAAAALTDELFLNAKDCLLSVINGYLSHYGSSSYITFIFLITFIATSCVLAIINTVLLLLKFNNHNTYPAHKVDIPICLDFKIMFLPYFMKSLSAFY